MVVPSHFSPLIGIPLTLAGSCLIAEFSGYWLHRLLHSDKIHFLSRGHLVHHFLIYAPGQPMRRKRYQDATDNRFSLGNIGLEGILPSRPHFVWCVVPYVSAADVALVSTL